MKLRAVTIDKILIPEFNGNKDLPAEEQLVIHFSRIPATSEIATYKSTKYDSLGNGQIVTNDSLMLSVFVSKIDNLTLDDGEKVRNGRELAAIANPLLVGLFAEIRNHLFPDGEVFSAGE